MPASPSPIALLMPGYFPLASFTCVHDYITVRCPACNATYVLALPRIPKFAGSVHAKVAMLKSTWGACGHHPQQIEVPEGAAAAG